MKKNNESTLINFPALLFKHGDGVKASDINNAIEKFRTTSPSVSLERLYDAYRSLKSLLDSFGSDFVSQSNHFNDIFLRIIEERGESETGIYRNVLRDSQEFRLLHEFLGKSPIPDMVSEAILIQVEELDPPVIEKPSLKKILAIKDNSFSRITRADWEELVSDYFSEVTEEKNFVKNCGLVLAKVMNRGDYQEFHTVCIIEYAFKRLLGYDDLQVTSKAFAMKLLNIVSGNKKIWNELHRSYLEIIKK